MTPPSLYRPRIGSISLSAITGLYLVMFTNRTFWGKVHTYLATTPTAITALYIAISVLFVAIVTAFSAKYVIKPVLIFLVLAAALAAWFTDTFGVIVDSDMIRNAMETTPAEANHLITPGFLLHVVLFAVIPITLILWVKVVHRPVLQKLLWNSVTILCCLLVFGAVAGVYAKEYTAAIRQHRDIVKSLNPVTPIVGATRYFMQAGKEARLVVKPLGTDARVVPVVDVHKPRVTIIVAGETARAMNFSLGGYHRDTNPELRKQGVIYFPQTTSCGTATATSIPCMFSQFTRASFTHRKGIENEGLMDVLAHAGIDVTWFDNNTGSKGAAARINYVDLANSTDRRFCKDGECQDGIFLDKLDTWLNGVTKDSVLVLHQIGSHGPAYYLRYPNEFRKFTPECETAELGNCKDDEIVNAYDNSILYTDHFLSTVIDKLKARSDKIATGLIYMSDHGESLGEKGLYLHGAPYFLAPEEQTHVPFVVWLDPDFTASMALDKACLAQSTAQPTSHDNLFHSVLGMMNISTSVYDAKLDVFAGCKTGRTS
ncbi:MULTISPECIES: phosphoethanolamine transferase [Rhizobium]|uniref:phosphoethanolamine transferase n=1 Tax=Rhizobium TaxID=379 RepID=UPI000462611D|nr:MULTISPECIES: phosphoethanolamine--lipid A transferase [Rhizobium]MCA0803521.1 phosphoethanolamine--lipid A transferase [Rhizobium sp. T1473]MCS0460876.1 phosphoethanolamine--lipid A transferase [Rhizobium favelukesii]UFS82890.1 phosphoethanolamine--lipid A transferase [Rhizobium sp. T136]